MPHLDANHYHNHSSFQYNTAQELLEQIGLSGSETILDVGCGDGKITAEMSQLVPDGKVIGVDPSPEMIEYAKEHFANAKYPNLTFKQLSAETIEDKADIILMLNSLHWVRDPKKSIDLAAELLNPGGSLYILTYPKATYLDFLNQTAKEDKWQDYADTAASKTILESHEYVELLKEAGLKITDVSTEERTAVYKTALDLYNYTKGWIGCYISLPENLEDKFLNSAVKKAVYLSVDPEKKEIHLPYILLKVAASKPQ